MNALLKHSGFPRSRCFQIENTGSKLEENTGISQITEISIVNWAIMMCTFYFCSHVWPRNANKKNSAENFPCGLLNTITSQVGEKLYVFVQVLFLMSILFFLIRIMFIRILRLKIAKI